MNDFLLYINILLWSLIISVTFYNIGMWVTQRHAATDTNSLDTFAEVFSLRGVRTIWWRSLEVVTVCIFAGSGMLFLLFLAGAFIHIFKFV